MTVWLILLGICLLVAFVGNQVRERQYRTQVQYLQAEREILEESLHTAILIINHFADRLDDIAAGDSTFKTQVEELLATHERTELIRKLKKGGV